MTAIAVTIAGSDSGGGAGIQADLKTFSALRVYGASVITALTAQNTQGVQAIHDVPADFIAAQMDSVFSDLKVDAVKDRHALARVGGDRGPSPQASNATAISRGPCSDPVMGGQLPGDRPAQRGCESRPCAPCSSPTPPSSPPTCPKLRANPRRGRRAGTRKDHARSGQGGNPPPWGPLCRADQGAGPRFRAPRALILPDRVDQRPHRFPGPPAANPRTKNHARANRLLHAFSSGHRRETGNRGTHACTPARRGGAKGLYQRRESRRGRDLDNRTRAWPPVHHFHSLLVEIMIKPPQRARV